MVRAIFFWPPPHKSQCPMSPMGHPLLKMDTTHWKVKPTSSKWFLEKKQKKETVINTWVSIIKHKTKKKMAEIPQKYDFLTWSIQNFIRKVNQFVRKYYITSFLNLANKFYDIKKMSWFYFMPCVIKKCLVLLRNSVHKPVE